MDTKTQGQRWERKLEQIRQQLLRLGPLHPGSISQQHHACGNPTCRCHHPTKPKKHGPYNKLTYVHHGKPVCRFVHPTHVKEVRARLTAYKTFRQLIDQWIALSIERGIVDFFTPAANRRRPPTAKTPE